LKIILSKCFFSGGQSECKINICKKLFIRLLKPFIFVYRKGAIECRFEFTESRGEQNSYTCLIEDQQIMDNHIPKFKNSDHLYGYSNFEVEKVQFINCNLTRVPSGLKDLFPRLNSLWISGSEIRHITNNELLLYHDLKEFVCTDCLIEYLPCNLFRFIYDIEMIWISGMFLDFIEPNILDGLDNLKCVNFRKSYHHSICYSIYPENKPNVTLEELKESLHDELFERYEKLDDLRNSEKELKAENQLLADLKAELELKILRFENSERAFNNQVKQLKTSNEILKKNNIQLKQSNNNFQRQIEELELEKEENEQLRNSINEQGQQVKHLKTTEIALNHQIQQLKSATGTIKKENAQLKQSNNNFQRQMQNFKTSEENLKKIEKNLKADKAKTDKEHQALNESQSKLIQQIQHLEKSEAILKEEIQRFRSFNDKYEDIQKQSKIVQADLNNQLQQLQNSNKNLKKENQDLKKIKSNLESKNIATISTSDLKTGLLTDLNTLIQDETTKDIRIIIEDQEFPVHKFLLAARSPTLAEILKNNPEVENLNLVDISVEIFEIILKFLYTDELPGDDGTNFLQLFAAAGKLKITKLVKYAATKIIGQVDSENAFEILRHSVFFGLDDLKQKAFQEVKKKYENISFNDELIDNPEKLVKIIATFKKREEAQKKFDEEIKELMTI